ncbi:MBG domain-containing protein, partial [Flavobacterium soyangense]
WSPSGGTAATASGLAAGSYTVTVTDANGCTATRNFTITQPSAISTATGSQTNVSCNGGTNGSASVSPSGGTAGYTYTWSPSGGTAATASGLAAGSYAVTVTDANGCTATRNFTITQPSAISTATGSQTNVSCNGGTNGSASVSPSGGTAGYTYTWSPSGGTAATATGLAAGSYTVTVTDANGCTATRNFTITQPSALSFTTTTLPGYDYNSSYSQNIDVTGGTGGKLYAVTAGSLPSGFTISSSGVITGTSTQVADSNFTVTVTDDNSCTAAYNFTLKLNQIPITVTATVSQTKVYGDNDPVFTYTVTPSLLSGDSFTGALTRVSGENIGNYAINQGNLSAGNKYLMTFVSKDFSISAKPIVVTAASKTKTYGEVDPALTYTFSPVLVTGDSFSGSLSRATGENVGAYAINQGTLALSGNYTLNYASSSLTIGKKTVMASAEAKTKTYGEVDPALTYTFSPVLVTGDSFSGSLSRATGENVGTYAINQGTLALSGNYTLNYTTANLTIGKKTVTVTAASQTKVYGATDPTFTYSVSPSLVNGDLFTGSLIRAVGNGVGLYAINQGSLSAGLNYTITYVGANLSITKADQRITWDQTLALGCDGQNSVSLNATSSSGLTVSYTSSNSGVVAVTNGSLISENYGSATVTASQVGNNNYNAASVVVLPVVNSQPNLIRKQFENIIFFDNSSYSFKSYTWYKNGVLVPSQTNQYFKESGALNGTYYAIATKLDGTLITTCSLTLSPTVEDEYIKLVPNPVKPNANYELITNVSTSRLLNARVEVYSAGGSLIENKTTSQSAVTLKAPTVEGIYIVKMTLANGKYFTKNILVKN